MRQAAASDNPIHVEGDAKLEFVRDGKTCNMKFLDADVKRPLASVSAIVVESGVEDDADCRSSGGQPESVEDEEVGEVWIVGTVEELEEEEETSEYHTHTP